MSYGVGGLLSTRHAYNELSKLMVLVDVDLNKWLGMMGNTVASRSTGYEDGDMQRFEVMGIVEPPPPSLPP